MQGDPMSPLLFNVKAADISQVIKALDTKAILYTYANDMVLCTKVQKNVQWGHGALTAMSTGHHIMLECASI
jgi:hypothetical protein